MKSIALLIVHSMTFAATEGGHGPGVPIVVLYQFINVATLGIILFFLIRKTVKTALLERFTSFADKARAARKIVEEAEANHRALKQKLHAVEETRTQVINEAQKNAAGLKEKMIQEARQQSQAMKLETEKSIRYEFERAKNDLKSEILEEVMASTKQALMNVDPKKQGNLNKNFVEGIRLN